MSSSKSISASTSIIYHSAAALYDASSDLSGIGGMYREYIRYPDDTLLEARRCTTHDCVFIERDADEVRFRALGVAQVFLSFYHSTAKYSCALVRWFEAVGDAPCPDTGMWPWPWVVRPDHSIRSRRRICTIVHIDSGSILRAAHLIGASGPSFLP